VANEREIKEITHIRIKEYDERIRLRGELEKCKRYGQILGSSAATLVVLHLHLHHLIKHHPTNSFPSKVATLEKMHHEDTTSEGQGSSNLETIAEGAETASQVNKRISLTNFNRRVRKVLEEQEGKFKVIVKVKKNLKKRLSLDSLNVPDSFRAVTGSVKKKVVCKQISMDTLPVKPVRITAASSKPTKVINRKLSFERAVADEGRYAKASVRTSARPSSATKRVPKKRLSLDSLSGSLKRGTARVFNQFPRV
jgi:hypothetical protein